MKRYKNIRVIKVVELVELIRAIRRIRVRMLLSFPRVTCRERREEEEPKSLDEGQ